MAHGTAPVYSLNAVCPYYTMFPLDFPLRVLKSQSLTKTSLVVDPFCGRGTTNFAARLLGLSSVGIDSSPVAVALSQAKLADASPSDVMRSLRRILSSQPSRVYTPSGDFWERAYDKTVLRQICWLRHELQVNCRSDARILLRAILLGALHGPLTMSAASHLSNQAPRTFAPKPNYATRYWKRNRLMPPKVDIVEVVRRRAERFLASRPAHVSSRVIRGDSRNTVLHPNERFALAITSPPYYGMCTYVPDQWLRNWFLGGPSSVPYRNPPQELSHASPTEFSANLKAVWQSLAANAKPSAKLVVRFGGISTRRIDSIQLLKNSLQDSGWRLRAVVSAGDANLGKRQAAQFVANKSNPLEEHDYYATLV